jgi:hypothetical protein
MLEIKSQEYYDRVVKFAEAKGWKKYLDQRLDYLRKYADQEEKGLCRVELYKDSSPASFAIRWYKRKEDGTYEYWFNGGLIFHGDQTGWDEKGEYVDPFAVRLVADNNPWGIHT